MSVIVELEGGTKCAIPIAPARPRATFYKLVGATTAHNFSNKDLTDPSNNLGAQATTPFTVSADFRFRGRFCTIQAAIDAASAVATVSDRRLVTIAPGTYNEIITLAQHVDLAGSGNSTRICGFFAYSAAGKATVSNLAVHSTRAAFTHTGGELVFEKCALFSSALSMVNNSAAVLVLSNCTIDSASSDILTITSASRTTITGTTVGSGIRGQVFSSNSGTTDIMNSAIRCRLYTLGGTCRAMYTHFTGADEPRTELLGGALEAYHCVFESPTAGAAAVVGTGVFHDDHNTFIGRDTIDPAITLHRRDERGTSGTYTPVITGENITSVDNAAGMYSRVGDIVNVKVSLTLTSTGGTGAFGFDMTVPLGGAASFASANEAIGGVLWGGGNIHLNTHIRAKTCAHVRAKVGSMLVTVGNIRNPNGTTTISGDFSYVLR